MHSERDEDLYGTGILFEEPKPNRSRPRDLIGLYKQQRKPQPRITQERARAATERRKRPKDGKYLRLYEGAEGRVSRGTHGHSLRVCGGV